jgi:hypothetical protein
MAAKQEREDGTMTHRNGVCSSPLVNDRHDYEEDLVYI